ncbi:MAG TPA: DUF885 domain-containing protein [Bryobacteraceae bacterium]|jgi:uncharacterized protein (DUF885 family)|nr:DUF885 domain-containing protein [Bryobacteraceae bacterium]
MTRPLFVLLLLAGTVACSRKTPSPDFDKITNDFVYTTLSFSPVTASGQGLHKYNGQDFDRDLDDLSFPAIQKQRDYYIGLHKRLEGFDKDSLSPEDRADYDIIDTQIGLALFDFDIARSWRHSPQMYVELLGSALFNPFVLEYAPKPERYEHIIARLQKIPQFIDNAHRQIGEAPPVWAQVAKEENDGNIDLIDKTLRDGAPPEQKKAYDLAASSALDSLRGFNRFLENDLPRRYANTAPDWRLGAEHYRAKFKLNLATDRSPDEVLKDAETRLKEVRARMLELSLPIHAAKYASHGDHADLKGDDRLNKIVREVLDGIAENHSTPASYIDDARKDLTEARNFARAKNLLTLPQNDNLQVIPTPEFERGIYGVGGFNPAPVLEPQLGAFFWITPIPPDWPKARVESKLREYNFYNLKLLVIHEAMPGHYVQGEFANAIEPKSRRILRAIYGNGPYVEGWAQYITQTMLDEGLLDNSPELRLTLLKQELRVDANAIIDIRIQTGRMTDEQAMDLMENSTFQEHEEAVAKLQRVKLSSTQLPTYFVGWRDWLRVRDLAKQTNGASFSLHDFHDRALKEGAVPLPVLGRLLTGKAL